MKKRSAIFLITGLIFFSLASSTQAEVRIALEPSSQNVIIKPGKSATTYYNLENGADPTFAYVNVRSLRPDSLYGNLQLFAEAKGPIQFRLQNNDITLGDDFLLQPHEKRRIALSIDVPSRTLEGDYYYALVLSSKAPTAVSGQVSLGVEAGVASPLMISITETGNLKTSARVSQFSTVGGLRVPLSTMRLIDSFSPVGIRLVVKNLGKYNLKTSGTLTIQNGLLTNMLIQFPSQYVLSQNQRLMRTPDDQCAKKVQTKQCAIPVSYSLSGFLLGKYTIQAKIPLPSSVYSQKIELIAFPFRLTIVSIMILVSFWYWKRHRP